MRPFLIDTDTASDDAVALIMALRWPGVAVKAITVVAGNMPLEQGARNARLAVELCGADVPISLGAGKPLLRANAHAEWFHGQDGLSDVGYAPREARFAPQHAVDTIIDTVKAHPGIELVTLGPLTNVALAVTRAPEIVPLVGRCVVMGGAACTEGNVTPAAEYNIWVDPEAARIVFHSGLPLEMVGWEHCRHDKVLSAAEIAHIQAFNTPLPSSPSAATRPPSALITCKRARTASALPTRWRWPSRSTRLWPSRAACITSTWRPKAS